MIRDGQPRNEWDAESTITRPAATRREAPSQFLSIEDIAVAGAAPRPRPAPQPTPTPPRPAATPPPRVTTATPPPRPAAAPAPSAEPAAMSSPPPPATVANPAATPSRPANPSAESPISASGAASQIAELLRAAHDTAARLRQHAEIEVKRTVDAARAEVQAHRQNQMRVLDAEQAAAEQLHAEIVHNARLAATEIRTQAEREAAEVRAAADAVFAQAAAHAHATRALVTHNLAEIEAAKHETVARSTELISTGRDIVSIVERLDATLSEKLAHTDRVLEWANATTARTAVS